MNAVTLESLRVAAAGSSPLASPWFRALPEELQTRLLGRARWRQWEQGRLLVCQGEIPEGLLAVVAGRVAVTHSLDPDQETLIDLAGPGCWHGVASLFGLPAVTSVTARTATEALLVPRREALALLADQPVALASLLRLQHEESAELISVIGEQRTLSPEGRIRRRLASLAARQRRARPFVPGATVLSLSQGDLAALVGLSRQTTHVLLHRLAERGLIALSFCRIAIPDPAALIHREELVEAWPRNGSRTEETPVRSARRVGA